MADLLRKDNYDDKGGILVEPSTAVLKHINSRLDLPQPVKARILLEIKADFEDAMSACINDGLSEQEAAAAATERFLLDDESLADLAELHNSSFRKWIRQFSAPVQTRWESSIVISALLIILVLGAQPVLSGPLLRQCSPFCIPLFVMGAAGLGLAFHKWYILFVLKEHNGQRIRRGMKYFPVLSLLCLITGWLGYLIALYRSGGGSGNYFQWLITYWPSSPESSERLNALVEGMMRVSSLMMICLFFTAGIALAWMLLEKKIQSIERQETMWLE